MCIKPYLRDRGLSQRDIAKAAGVGESTVSRWFAYLRDPKTGYPIPAEAAVKLEDAVGIPRHMLRPDLWPLDLVGAPASERAA